ncbi:hypothetical protein BKA62DRAFT_784010 [Auriculariales sp. MPI-PUGE-AT-0066]|nr:hypothetical protein BKA62DRAFT_784010 [Auriculariales sp. MPI-PUGE-AT-0066]
MLRDSQKFGTPLGPGSAIDSSATCSSTDGHPGSLSLGANSFCAEESDDHNRSYAQGNPKLTDTLVLPLQQIQSVYLRSHRTVHYANSSDVVTSGLPSYAPLLTVSGVGGRAAPAGETNSPYSGTVDDALSLAQLLPTGAARGDKIKVATKVSHPAVRDCALVAGSLRWSGLVAIEQGHTGDETGQNGDLVTGLNGRFHGLPAEQETRRRLAAYSPTLGSELGTPKSNAFTGALRDSFNAPGFASACPRA